MLIGYFMMGFIVYMSMLTTSGTIINGRTTTSPEVCYITTTISPMTTTSYITTTLLISIILITSFLTITTTTTVTSFITITTTAITYHPIYPSHQSTILVHHHHYYHQPYPNYHYSPLLQQSNTNCSCPLFSLLNSYSSPTNQ